MLARVHRLAYRLLPIRPVLIGLVGFGAVCAAVGLLAFSGSGGNHILMPAILLVLWAVTGLVFIDVFGHAPRPPHGNRDGWSTRWFGKLRQGLHWALVLAFVVLALTVVDLSLYVADAWLDGPSETKTRS